jgi:hypothetical protein
VYTNKIFFIIQLYKIGHSTHLIRKVCIEHSKCVLEYLHLKQTEKKFLSDTKLDIKLLF